MAKSKKFKIYYARARVHHLSIFQYDKNGNLFMTLEKLEECILAHAGGYETYAIVLHDSDVYNGDDCCIYAEKNKVAFLERLQILSDAKGLPKDETTESGFVYDEELEKSAHAYADELFPPILPGTPKKPHWHVVLTFTQARALDEVARWFKGLNGLTLDPHWNEKKTGHGAAENAWLYLVHANDPKKYQYNKEDVVASFDYINELDVLIRKHEDHEKYNLSKGDFNDVIAQVMHGLSRKGAMNIVSEAEYMRNEAVFERARRWYVMNEAPMPLFREVFYVESQGLDDDHGKGGMGKTLCAKALAKQLAKEFGADVSKDINDLQEFIYIAGDAGVFLQNYDAQPVLLVDEINGSAFKEAVGGVLGVKSLLSPFPERKDFNKKFGSVICTAKYIIINGIESFEKFKTELAKGGMIKGRYQESEESVKEQFDRRFWGDIKIVDASQIEIWLNRGLFDNTPEQQVLQMVCRVRASFQQIASRSSGMAQARLEERVLHPLLEEVDKSQITHCSENKISDPDAIPEDLLCMGEVIVDDDIQEPIVIDSMDARCSLDVFNKMKEMCIIDNDDMDATIFDLDAIQRAIDYHFKKIPFDDVKDRMKRQIIFGALMAIDKMQKGG